MKEDIRKILVIKLRAIGDVVLSTAVLPSLRNGFPGSEIHFLVDHSGRDVLIGNPCVDRILSPPHSKKDRSGRKIRQGDALRFLKMIRKEKYDLVFDLFGNPRSAFLTWITAAPMRVGFTFRGRKYAYNCRVVPRGDRIHEVEFNLDGLRALGLPIVDAFPRFYYSDKDKDVIDRWMKKRGLENTFLIGLHCWGGWETKRWGLDRFAALSDLLSKVKEAKILLLWGPGERKHAEKVQSLAHYPTFIAPETSLKQLGVLLSRCQIVIANDSGPMHISAAVGTPTVGIFGPTQWKLQGPFGKGHRVVYKKGLSCLGCNRTSCKEMICMKNLGVDDVMQVVEKVIRQNSYIQEHQKELNCL
ncbi:glycosyltransferase family 9 protein [bacterium]|nr:glycosyltransferase family 9 protein [bacterium]RQV95881.1 MAG: glycosyltransferase family 9 protein [bacterium]